MRISLIVSKRCVVPSGGSVGASDAAERMEYAAEVRAGADSRPRCHTSVR